MQLLRRLKTGFVLTKDSLLVMRHNPELFLFPAVSGLAGLGFLVVFLGVTFGLLAASLDALALVGLFVTYLVLTFVSSFFAAAMVHQTREVLAGSDASLREGMAAAWEVKGSLLVWSLISATVGILINAIENSDSRLGRLVGAVFGVAWTLMTFFVVPVIVFERVSTKEMFTRSAGTFKQTWGETPISLLGINVVSAVVALPFALPGIYLFDAGFVLTGIGLLFVGALLSFLIAQTLQGVVKTTLYLYASDGTRPEEFDNVDFDGLASQRQGTGRRSPMSGGFR
jgi:hypothetical protein